MARETGKRGQVLSIIKLSNGLFDLNLRYMLQRGQRHVNYNNWRRDKEKTAMLYCLSHNNVELRNGKPYELDFKLIGHYATLDYALAAKKRYAEKKGFSSFPEGFCIDLVLPCDNDRKMDSCHVSIVYRIGYSSIDHARSLEFFIEGYYSSIETANSALNKLKKNPMFSKSSENLEICEVIVDRSYWIDGFDNYEW